MNSTDYPELAAWRKLAASPAVRGQQVAFTCATGVPLTLAPASLHAPDERTFCVKGCLGGASGVACRRQLLQAEQRAVARHGPVQYACPSGLVKILVPVFLNGRHAGLLLAGPLARHALDENRLRQLAGRLEKSGLGGRADQLPAAWEFTPRLSAAKCQAAETLLGMFAQYLAETGKAYLHSQAAPASPLLRKIETFLAGSPDGQVTLKEVAASVNLSPCHFCAVFKKQTGLTFTRYRVRQRLDKARELLADRARRVSDAAFDSGFESIPYFNRAFRAAFGCSPTAYRRRLGAPNPGQANRNPGVAPSAPAGFNNRLANQRLPLPGRPWKMPLTAPPNSPKS